ncbi:unnamed protein product [Durusdinium trenchii]|uniref:Uncharacterized protein n=1 Tax=Durusdinium trenchii TaxID=1381693 RepID=A0ABP0PT83_9DINO
MAAHNDAKEARVEEEFLKIRRTNYKFFCRGLCHVDFVLSLFFGYKVFEAPGLDSMALFVMCIISYVHYSTVSKDSVHLTACQLKVASYLLHVLCMGGILAAAFPGNASNVAMNQGFAITFRFCLVFAFLDPWMTIPFQVLYTTLELLIYFCVLAPGVEVMQLCCAQLFLFLLVTVSSVLMDVALRGQIDALLDTADADSLISSFRSMLRGVCDGEVLLDSGMNVARESECLQHLILSDVSLVGRSFERLIVAEERTRFKTFIESSTVSGESTKCSAPPVCLRISLNAAANIRVGADLYHVPVPGLFGASEPYHLIAFKEDPDSRPPPEALENAVPQELLTTQREAGAEAGARRGSAPCPGFSSSTASTGGSGLELCKELQQMTLLVDVDTDFQDVQKAHLTFQRTENETEEMGPGTRWGEESWISDCD